MSKIPENYFCWQCKATGKKLWRDYNRSCFNLCCFNCSGETKEVDENGKVEASFPELRIDEIKGCRFPAVPVFDSQDEAYWGFHDVPKKEVDWWRSLPSK